MEQLGVRFHVDLEVVLKERGGCSDATARVDVHHPVDSLIGEQDGFVGLVGDQKLVIFEAHGEFDYGFDRVRFGETEQALNRHVFVEG